VSPRRILSIPVLALVALVLVLAGTAAAYFTAEGDGQGDASTTTLEDLIVTAGTATNALHPGGTADAVLVVENPNPFAVAIVAIVAGEGDVVADGTDCEQSDVSFVAPAQSTIDELDLLEPDSSTTITLPGAVAMGTGSDSGCQGAAFEVPVTVEVIR
jgi:hypothetical protein